MDVDILNRIKKTGSRLDKEKLLSTVNKQTVEMLKWALDPMITFGITVDMVEMGEAWASDRHQFKYAVTDDFWKRMDGLCENLSLRKLTGNNAKETVKKVLLFAPTPEDLDWAGCVLNKDPRCGIQVSTLNKVFPGTIEPFSCALAKPYEPEKHELQGAWCVEPKLDGLRMVVLDGVAYTRNGRTIDSVGHILKELEPFKDEYVFDGEVMGETEFNEDSGKIRKKGMGPNLSLKYNIFDVIHRDEWVQRKTGPTLDRKQLLLRLFNPEEIMEAASFKYIKKVPFKTMPPNPTSEKLFELRDKFIKDGYEGVMLKDLSAPYVFKRSDSVLKLKDFLDADGRIVDTFEGKGKHKGRLGGVIAEFDGVQTRVGSGFTDLQRDTYWTGRKSLVGRMIEVKYQNKTPDGSLRFPVFIRFRPDKE